MELSFDQQNNSFLAPLKQTNLAQFLPSKNYLSISSVGYPVVHNSEGEFKTLCNLEGCLYYIEGSVMDADDDGVNYGVVEKFLPVSLSPLKDKAIATTKQPPIQVTSLLYFSFGHLDYLSNGDNTEYFDDCFKAGVFKIASLQSSFDKLYKN